MKKALPAILALVAVVLIGKGTVDAAYKRGLQDSCEEVVQMFYQGMAPPTEVKEACEGYVKEKLKQ